MDYQSPPRRRIETARIVAIYALFGLAWIYGSDTVLGWVIYDPEQMVKIAVVKGSLFILCTAALLYFLISRFARQLATAEMGQIESLKNYQAIFNATNESIFVHDAETGGIVDVNTRTLEIFGCTREEVLTTDIGHLSAGVFPYTQAEAIEKMRKALQEGPQVFQWLCRKKAGELFWTEVSLRRITTQGYDRIIAVVRDIGERKRLDDELRKSEERYRTILDSAMDGFIAVNSLGQILDVNPSFCRMSGYGRQQLLGMSIADLEVTQSAEETISHIRKIIELGEDRFESRHRRQDGSIFDVEVSAQYRSDEGGQVVAFLRDITERKHSVEALRENQAKLQAALSSMTDAVFISDVAGNFIDFNDAFATFHRFTSKDECARTLSEYPEILEVFMADGELAPLEMWAVPRALRGETVTNAEYRLRRKDTGETWTGSYSFSPVRDKDRQIVGTVVVGRDITDRKRAEQEKILLEVQLQQSQKMESVGRLAGGVAHDFNNMLTIILGYAHLGLLDLTPAHPTYAKLEEIRIAAERSADLTQQLLAFARKQIVAPKVLDLNEIVENMLKMLRRLIGEDIHLVWQPSNTLWPVMIDPSQIDQILANLCINARDAITAAGKITIETGNSSIDKDYCAANFGFVPGEYVLLVVSDNGCGMDKETAKHIFEPFFTTKGVGEGTGLGLSTVYGIVRQNNGFINIYSEPGQGTTFKIYLPRYVGREEPARLEATAKALSPGHETILLVEDESSILAMTTRLLETQGYNVLAANTPSIAIDLAKTHGTGIQLLMTDVVMPEMNGRELAGKLMTLCPGLKCLYMSGYTANVIAHHGVLDEDVHFITKPFSLPDVAAKVREVLEA